MNDWLWYLTRSTGIVAALLAVAALVWGLFFSSRNTGTRLKPNWWLALHNWLGGLTFAFIGIHMVLSVLDTQTGLGIVDLFVPSSAVGWAIGWGVVAFWLFALVVIPSMARIRRRLPRKAWHLVHLLSIPATVLTLVHAYQAGSDSLQSYFTRGLAILVGIAIYPVSIRLIGIAQRRRPLAA
ncbi:MAG: ferric reductase-like transmembrane domain-containing protein [Actinomycetota bacterium]|nr:ferric reductase-like transmembrane domain-containing protein [Actinomycetota bacterium]